MFKKGYRPSIPNILSYLRLLLIPFLWNIYLSGSITLLAAGIIVAAATDIFDGFLARKLRVVSDYGSKLDSTADSILTVSVIYWTISLYPEIFTNHSLLLLLWGTLLLLAGIIGFVKFQRIGNLHLYSCKMATVISYAFVIYTYLFGYNPALFYLSIIMLIISSLEVIILQLHSKRVDEHMGSILFHLKWNIMNISERR